MSFYEYIQTFKDDKTPLGELAIGLKKMIHSQNKRS
ncbi:Putative cytosolic protein [Staphylococcus aureus]|nr:Putative cytosolic protein [Staphylococcus aureus]